MCNRHLVIERVKKGIAIAQEQWPSETFKFPDILFTKRGTTAGTANSTKWQLNFNEILLNENVEIFVKQTVMHELAHLIDHQVYDSHAPRFDRRGRRMKRSPHGRNWKNIMLVLGVPADRCHKMDVSNAKIHRAKSATFDYKCTGCDTVMTMGKIRHNKQQSGMANYRHNGCRGAQLIFIG